jgi:hypothetical protein
MWSCEVRSRPTQAAAERVNHGHDFPHTRVRCWATHQVAGSGCSAPPQVTHCLETFQKSLPCLSPRQPSAVAQPITHWHMTALNCFGRLPACAVQPCPDVVSARAVGRQYRARRKSAMLQACMN